MADIVFISTVSSLTSVIHTYQEKNGLSFPVYEATMSKALDFAKRSIKGGAKIIISRGYTAELLSKQLEIPVVPIKHNFFDIHLAVTKALKKSSKIGVIGFETMCDAAQRYESCMDFKFVCIHKRQKSESPDTWAKKMKQLGVEVLIGGLSYKPIANKYPFEFVICECSEYSVSDALTIASMYLQIENERQHRQESINALISSISEGVIGCDPDGQIKYINDSAKRMLCYFHQKSIYDLLPEIELDKKGDFLTKVGLNNLAVSIAPILPRSAKSGYVVTLQAQDYIQDIDRRIRKKQIGRGHIAKNTFDDIVGTSNLIAQVKEKAKKYATSDSTVLLMGETGVGKEIFAQSIHNWSNRKFKPFVAVNCAALPASILESEFFGYEKGAFTGARSEGKAGIFEIAHTGTVFLDEISEIPLDMQAKLLRVLQEKEFTRVGGDKTIPVDVRIIASSNRNLKKSVKEGSFRQDMYFRIAVLELEIPPLRARKEDILDLVQYYIENNIKSLRQISPEGMRILENYDWPGNIRQLFNIIQRLDILNSDGVASDSDVIEALGLWLKKDDEENNDLNLLYAEQGNLLAQKEDEIIKKVLQSVGGNKEKAAAILGISHTTLWRKMKSLN